MPPSASVVLTGLWPYADRQRAPYLYIPFDVPPGVGTLRAAYRTTLKSGAGSEHVDIGIFDPRGHAFGSAAGFRGWSGAARDHFYLSEAAATPGYIAGPLEPGTWHIVLGTESRKQADVTYTVEVQFDAEAAPGSPAPQRAPFSDSCLRGGPAYFRGDLHCHTVHSDGMHPLETVAQRACDRGLDFLCITNHNVLATQADLAAEWLDAFLLMGGQEVTTYRGHLNVWGIRDWVEFRAHTDDQMQAIVAAAHARGAVTSINHPRDGGPAWEYEHLPSIDCLEVWNGPWVVNNYQSLTLYDRLLCQGRRMTAVGGSDIHVVSMPDAPYPYELGNPTTHVYAGELSERGILDGLRMGRICITADPTEQWAELRAEAGGQSAVMGEALTSGDQWRVTVEARGLDDAVVALISDGNEIACLPVSAARGVEVPAPVHYLRAQILREPAPVPDDWFVLALTNPIYRTARPV